MKIVLLILTLFLQTPEYKGKIIHVSDGDTFVLQTNGGNLKVRLEGVDAPEKNQPFGVESKAFLNKFLYKEAKVVYSGLDKYGRTLGILYVDGKNINLLSVEKDFAWHYEKLNQKAPRFN